MRIMPMTTRPTRFARLLPLLLLLLALPAGAQPEEAEPDPPLRRLQGDRVSVGGETIVIPAGTVQAGNVTGVLGSVRIEGVVTGNVTVVGGSITVSGSVRGHLVAVLTDVELEPGARIGGDLHNVAGSLEDRGSEIRGGLTNIPLGLTLGDATKPLGALLSLVVLGRGLGLVLFFAVILLVAALVPDRVRAISESVRSRYLAALFVGLLGYVLVFLLWVLSAVTIVGLFLVPLVFLLLKWMAMAGMLHALGERLGGGPNRSLSLLGAIFIGFIPYALIVVQPLFFGLLGLLFGMASKLLLFLFFELPAVGLLLLTQAGGRAGAAPVVASAVLAPVSPAPAPGPVEVPEDEPPASQ